jgi:hypothetical protein
VVVRAAGIALAMLVVPEPAQAQDATGVVVAIVPPFLLAPLFLAGARWFWRRRGCQLPARFLPLLGVACVEVFLWAVLVVTTLVFMTGDWHIRVALPLAGAAGALWVLSGIWGDPSRRSARWLYLVSPPLALLLLGAATLVVLFAAFS